MPTTTAPGPAITFNPDPPEFVNESPDYQEACRIDLAFPDYGQAEWLYEYAMEQHRHQLSSLDVLDTKAETIAKGCAAVIAGSAALFTYMASDVTGVGLFFLVIGLALTFVAGAIALVAREPKNIVGAPTLTMMADGIREYQTEGLTKVAAVRMLARTVGWNKAVNDRKADRVRESVRYFAAGLGFLTVAVIISRWPY